MSDNSNNELINKIRMQLEKVWEVYKKITHHEILNKNN